MAQSIRDQSVLNQIPKRNNDQGFAHYILVKLNWFPRKFNDFRRVQASIQVLVGLEDKIYRYKLRWGFSKVGSETSSKADSEARYLDPDGLDEAVRSLIFKMDNYSLYEKLFALDAAQFEMQVLNYCRELEDILSANENT